MRSLPNQNEPVVVPEDGKARIPWYGWFDELWRKLRPLWSIDDGKLLFMDGTTIAGATVGEGLTLDRTTNTLTATGTGTSFPEAPIDNYQYGRQNATWTRVATVGGTTSPGAPRYAVQYNDPLGTFAGHADFTFDQTNKYLLLGTATASPYTISPVAQSAGNTVGVEIKLRGGTGYGSGTGGTVRVIGGTAGATATAGGAVSIEGGQGPGGAGGNVDIISGNGSAANTSGEVSIITNSPTGSGATGQVFLRSGQVTSTSGTNASGQVTIGTGANSGTAGIAGTGNLLIQTGGGRNTGNINLTTGSLTGGSGIAGDIILTGGNATVGTPGDISLTAGTGPSGVLGYIDLVGRVRTNGFTAAPGAPYFVDTGLTYTVEGSMQVLFAMPLEIDGTVVIDGYLIEVD